MNKGLLLVAVLLSLGLMASVSTVMYAEVGRQTRVPMFQRMAQRFNLDPNDVKKVFEEGRQERYEDRLDEMSERMDDMVKAGKINASQKSLMLNKFKEMHEKRLSFSTLSVDERHQKMIELRAEYKKWLTDNNIDLKVFKFGGMRMHGFGGMMDQ